MGPFLLPKLMYNCFMNYSEDLEQDIIALRSSTDFKINQLMELAAMNERAKIFRKLGDLIQQKDSSNDVIAAKVLAWAWKELSS